MSALHSPRREKSFHKLTSMVAVHLEQLPEPTVFQVATYCASIMADVLPVPGLTETERVMRRAMVGTAIVYMVGDQTRLHAELVQLGVFTPPKTVHAWAELLSANTNLHAPHTSTCEVALTGSRPQSLLQLFARIRLIVLAGISPEYRVVFTGEHAGAVTHAQDMQSRLQLHTLQDWMRLRARVMPLTSTFCPNCGREAFVDPLVYCPHCGENPGTVRERAHDFGTS